MSRFGRILNPISQQKLGCNEEFSRVQSHKQESWSVPEWRSLFETSRSEQAQCLPWTSEWHLHYRRWRFANTPRVCYFSESEMVAKFHPTFQEQYVNIELTLPEFKYSQKFDEISGYSFPLGTSEYDVVWIKLNEHQIFSCGRGPNSSNCHRIYPNPQL